MTSINFKDIFPYLALGLCMWLMVEWALVARTANKLNELSIKETELAIEVYELELEKRK